jgi:hypothetical protein
MDNITSQIQSIVDKHATQVATEVGNIVGAQFKAGLNGIAHETSAAVNGIAAGIATGAAMNTTAAPKPKRTKKNAKKATKAAPAAKAAKAKPAKAAKEGAARGVGLLGAQRDEAREPDERDPVGRYLQRARHHRAKKTAPGEKRDPAVLGALVERLHGYVKANPGQGIEPIAKALKSTSRELNLPMKKLIKAKRVTVVGKKRSTKYTGV